MPTFSVRCLFLWAPRSDQAAKNLYEERITLWNTSDIEQAIKLAEVEARGYASEGDRYLGVAQAYALYDDITAEGTEVFSLLRESDLEPDAYVSAFFKTGKERTR
jgi:hypothetical protein